MRQTYSDDASTHSRLTFKYYISTKKKIKQQRKVSSKEAAKRKD